MAKFKRWLIISNLLAVFIIIHLLIKHHYPSNFYKKVVGNKHHNFLNENYNTNVNLFQLYTAQRNIVLLGDSFTEHVHWAEFMDRKDIAERGIGNDVTAGYIHRLEYVFHAQPKICFIEGGYNDLTYNIPHENIIKNLTKIVDTLKAKNIIPVLNAVPFVTRRKDNSESLNKKIFALNQGIKNLAKHNHIQLINLNPSVSNDKYRRPEYATKDGVHFNKKTYLIWRNQIETVLDYYGI